MLRDSQLWMKIGRVCTLLAKRLDISPERAFDIFQNSRTCDLLHDERSLLYLMSDGYIVDDVVRELQFPSFGYRSHLQSRQCQRQRRGSGAPGQQGEENGAEIGRADEKESKVLKILFSDYLSTVRVYLSSFLPYLLTI